PLIVPLMIAGIALVLLGIALLIWRFVEFRRRAKRTSGRRAAQRGDYTGLTAADVMAGSESTTQTLSVEQIEAGEPVQDPQTDQATEVVAGLPLTEDDQLADEDELAIRGSTADKTSRVDEPADNTDPEDDHLDDD